MNRAMASQKELENPLRKPVNTLAIVPTKSSKITVLARKAYNVLLYIAQERGIDKRCSAHLCRASSAASTSIPTPEKSSSSTYAQWSAPPSSGSRRRQGEAWNVAGLLAHPRSTSSPARTGSNGPLRQHQSVSLLEPQRISFVCASTSSRSYGVIPAWCALESAPDIATWASPRGSRGRGGGLC